MDSFLVVGLWMLHLNEARDPNCSSPLQLDAYLDLEISQVSRAENILELSLYLGHIAAKHPLFC